MKIKKYQNTTFTWILEITLVDLDLTHGLVSSTRVSCLASLQKIRWDFFDVISLIWFQTKGLLFCGSQWYRELLSSIFFLNEGFKSGFRNNWQYYLQRPLIAYLQNLEFYTW